MMLLWFFVLSIFTVFKSYAENIEQDGEPSRVACGWTSKASIDSEPVPWKSDYIFPVLLCVRLNGITKPCGNSERAIIQLQLSAKRPLKLTDIIGPKDFDASKKAHCHLFHASEIANLLKDDSLADTLYRSNAIVLGIPEGTTTPTFQLIARALSYNISQPTTNIKATPSDDPTVHAVICSFPNCKVVADGFSPTRTEFFTIRKGETPQYEKEWDGPLTQGMFSVTSFECEPDECPTKFSAVE